MNERSWPRESPAYRALDLTFAARFVGADLADYVESILAPLTTEPVAVADTERYSVVDEGERYRHRYAVYFGGQPVGRTTNEPEALLYLLWHLNRAVVAASDRYLLVHAAAATANGTAILLPAPMDSGKTTLVAGLLLRGFGYLSDEIAAIDPATRRVDPYPKALSIELGSWEVLEPLRPAPDPRFTRFTDENWRVVPDAIRPGAVAPASTARVIVCPRFEPGAKTAIEPVSRAEGLMLLAENAFNFAAHKTNGLHTLAAVVRQCECYRLTVGSLEAACDEIEAVVERIDARVA